MFESLKLISCFFEPVCICMVCTRYHGRITCNYNNSDKGTGVDIRGERVNGEGVRYLSHPRQGAAEGE